MKTWYAEHAVVVAVLAAVWLATGYEPREALGSLAVYLAFSHASVGERMREREAARAVPTVECHSMSTVYFVGKEVAWAAYFLLSGTYAALVGCAVFAAYPLWRHQWRRVHPLTSPPSCGVESVPTAMLLAELRAREIDTPVASPRLLSDQVRSIFRCHGGESGTEVSAELAAVARPYDWTAPCEVPRA